MRVPGLSLSLPLLLAVACTPAGSSRTARAPDGNRAPPAASQPAAPAPAATPGVSSTALADLEHAFEHAAGVIAPAVVSITSERPVAEDLPPFLRPFGPPDGHVRGMGSGVLIDDEGRILTNNHVVENADTLLVKLSDDREVEAEVIGTDPKTDLAVIRIDPPGLRPAQLAPDRDLRVGQWVLAAGSPFGLPRTVTAGIVSAVGRGSMGIADYGDFIQTDASINQGNSGGPLVDLQGRVVGINTAIASRDGGSNGIGFAIPVALARMIMGQLIAHGSVERGWLGIVMGELTPELAASFGYTGTGGVLIDDLDPSGPAAKAGVAPGDIVAELDGKPVRDMAAFRNAIAQRRPGTPVKLTTVRGGASHALKVVLEPLPDFGRPSRSRGSSTPTRPKVSPHREAGPRLGLRLEDPSPQMRRRIGLVAGRGAVVVDVARGSIAAGSELVPGDVLVEVGGKAVRSADHARQMLDHGDFRRGVRVRVQRGQFGHFAVLKAES